MYKNEPIFRKPVFQERIWGGIKLKTEFSYDIPSEKQEKLGDSRPSAWLKYN